MSTRIHASLFGNDEVSGYIVAVNGEIRRERVEHFTQAARHGMHQYVYGAYNSFRSTCTDVDVTVITREDVYAEVFTATTGNVRLYGYWKRTPTKAAFVVHEERSVEERAEFMSRIVRTLCNW